MLKKKETLNPNVAVYHVQNHKSDRSIMDIPANYEPIIQTRSQMRQQNNFDTDMHGLENMNNNNIS